MKFKFYVPDLKYFEDIVSRKFNISDIEYANEIYSKNFPLHILKKK